MSSEMQSLASFAISGLALLVSGIALGWTIYRDVLDKGRLKVQLMIGRLVPGAGGAAPVFISSTLHAEMVASGDATDKGFDQIVVTITNVGRRPIVVTRLAGRQSPKGTGKNRFVIGTRQLPKTLQPGEFAMDWLDNPILLGDLVKGIFVTDSADRQWSASRRNFRKTKADARRFLKPLPATGQMDRLRGKP